MSVCACMCICTSTTAMFSECNVCCHTSDTLASSQSEPSYNAVPVARLTCRFVCIRQPVLSSSTSAPCSSGPLS